MQIHRAKSCENSPKSLAVQELGIALMAGKLANFGDEIQQIESEMISKIPIGTEKISVSFAIRHGKYGALEAEVDHDSIMLSMEYASASSPILTRLGIFK